MSFRNTFITDFIYQASDDTKEANAKVLGVLKKYTTSIDKTPDERGYGYYSGQIDTLGGSLGEITDYKIDQCIRELEKATKVPFRLVILLESNAVITYNIEPTESYRSDK